MSIEFDGMESVREEGRMRELKADVRHVHSVKHRSRREDAHCLPYNSIEIGKGHEGVVVEITVVVLTSFPNLITKLPLDLLVLRQNVKEVAHAAGSGFVACDNERTIGRVSGLYFA
jgi:hypothetical protein